MYVPDGRVCVVAWTAMTDRPADAPDEAPDAASSAAPERPRARWRAAAPALWRSLWPGLLAWQLAWAAMLLLDGQVDLASQAMLLILAAALAAIWWRPLPAALAIGAGVMGFNFAFVPPRGTFAVDLQHHGLLLLAMLGVSWIISALMARLRATAAQAAAQAARADQLRRWGDRLRDAEDPATLGDALLALLGQASGRPAALWLDTAAGDRPGDAGASPGRLLGRADAEQQARLRRCRHEGRPLGRGSGRLEDQPDAYLPLRGRGACLGAALLAGLEAGPELPDSAELRAQLQALCDQMGAALQRAQAARQERQAREQAQQQGLRNALLAAISHDYRTPLATIMGAASALETQAERLDAARRRQLAHGIVEEAERLARLTDNTLQLARLDAPGVQLHCDWESAEELVGSALRQARRHDPTRRLRARLAPDLPLLWCDALLLSQLLANLIDNALKYSPEGSPVELRARRDGARRFLLAVRDRGPAIPPAEREAIFEVFQRGRLPAGSDPRTRAPGAGVGLAVCRAVARSHGGELRLRIRPGGGNAFECLLPLREPPSEPPPEPALDPSVDPAPGPAPGPGPVPMPRDDAPEGRP